MGLDVTAVPFGRPAVELLASKVAAAKVGDLLAPVTVVVGNNFVGTAMRRALAAAGGVAAVSFITLHRLAEQLGAPSLARAGRRPVSAPFVVAAVREVLRREPGVFAGVADHPATEQALAQAWRELADVRPEGLEALRRQSDRAADVVRVAGEARRRLSGEWFDEHDLLGAAAGAIKAGSPLVGQLGCVIVHLPSKISRAGAALLRAMGERIPVAVHVGVTGDARADRSARDVAARLGVELDIGEVQRATATRIVSVSDPDEEVRAAVHRLVDAMRAGVPLGRTAILYGTAEPYARLVHEHLEAAVLPHNGAPVRVIGDALLGRTLRGLLALPDSEFGRRDVLALLSCNFILGDDGRRVPSRAWERVSRAAGVVDGDDWDRRLGAFAIEAEARAGAAEAEGQSGRAAALRRDAEQARALSTFVAGLRRLLVEGEEAAGWAEKVAWAHRLLQRCLGDEAGRAGWPEEERQAAERVEQALDRLAGLDALGGLPPSLALFRRTFEAELEAGLGRVGRFGEGVLVADVASAVGLCLDLVIVLGLAEGAFPARRLDDSLLPDREREAAGGELPLRAERAHDDHRALLAVLAGAGDAVLCFPRGDLRRRGERTASRWLLDSAGALSRSPRPLFTRDLAGLAGRPWLDHTPSFVAGLQRRGFPATPQEHDLATLFRAGATAHSALRTPVVAADAVIRTGTEMVLARAGSAFTRFDGNLAHLDLPDPTEKVWSTSRLEAWARCPHAYLLEHVLGVVVREDPDEIMEIDPLSKGALVHKVLERFVEEAIAEGRAAGPWTEADRARLRTIGEEVCAEYHAKGVTGRRVFWDRDRARILADLERFLGHDNSRRAAGAARPVEAELAFGMAAEQPSVAIELPDGRTLRFRGKVDRVDRCADGSLTVIDYKTGASSDYNHVADDPGRGGTHLQLRVYAEAARAAFGTATTPVRSGYWFVTTKGRFEWRGYEVSEEVARRVDVVLAQIVDGIGAGIFPARPSKDPPYGWVDCHYCDADGLGTSQLRREWERKRDDPALVAYARLAEPEEAGDG